MLGLLLVVLIVTGSRRVAGREMALLLVDSVRGGTRRNAPAWLMSMGIYRCVSYKCCGREERGIIKRSKMTTTTLREIHASTREKLP